MQNIRKELFGLFITMLLGLAAGVNTKAEPVEEGVKLVEDGSEQVLEADSVTSYKITTKSGTEPVIKYEPSEVSLSGTGTATITASTDAIPRTVEADGKKTVYQWDGWDSDYSGVDFSDATTGRKSSVTIALSKVSPGNDVISAKTQTVSMSFNPDINSDTVVLKRGQSSAYRTIEISYSGIYGSYTKDWVTSVSINGHVLKSNEWTWSGSQFKFTVPADLDKAYVKENSELKIEMWDGNAFVRHFKMVEDEPVLYKLKVVADPAEGGTVSVINSGTGKKSRGSTVEITGEEGDKIFLQALPAEEKEFIKWEFQKWTSSDGVIFDNALNEDAEFTMPSRDVTVKARFKRTVKTVSIRNAKVSLSKTSFVYNGARQRPTIKKIGGKVLKKGTDYDVKWSSSTSKNVGTYTVTITGKGNYTGKTTATYKITKASNTLNVSAVKGTYNVPYSKLKKNTCHIKASKIYSYTKKNKIIGDLKYTISSIKKNGKSAKSGFSVGRTSGKLTVKKGVKKGTYTVHIKVTAAGNKNYSKASEIVKFKVKIR